MFLVKMKQTFHLFCFIFHLCIYAENPEVRIKTLFRIKSIVLNPFIESSSYFCSGRWPLERHLSVVVVDSDQCIGLTTAIAVF